MSHDATEYEGKILDIDADQVAKKIEAMGGRKIGDHTFRRYVFDVVPAKDSSWIRLRTNGDETTLTVKEIRDDSIDGTDEWEVVVSDFDTTLKILEKSGIAHKGYQENRRVEYELNGVSLCIDYWPQIPVYLEIEGKNKAAVEKAATELGFSTEELTGMNTTRVYSHYGIDLATIRDLKF